MLALLSLTGCRLEKCRGETSAWLKASQLAELRQTVVVGNKSPPCMCNLAYRLSEAILAIAVQSLNHAYMSECRHAVIRNPTIGDVWTGAAIAGPACYADADAHLLA